MRLAAIVATGAAAGCAAALLALPAAAAPAPPTIPDCYSLVTAPSAMVLACGDGNLTLEGLSWQNWGGETATAEGTARANDCDPYCAAGIFREYPVTVIASAPQTCASGRRQYTRLEWSTQAKPPPGQANPAGSMEMPCTWKLHPALTAKRATGKVVLAGKSWTRGTGCPAKVRLTAGGKKIADVPLTGTGFSYTWRAPAGRHVIVARQTCGNATLFEASVVVR